MRNLVVCCDGTWNTPEQEAVSNAYRLYNAVVEVPEDGPEQKRYYHSGVGTEGGLVNWVLGGVSGVGLSQDVMHAYHWLTTTYQPGDCVSLFGFSRGAYTARSLAGMVAACGLLDTGCLDEPAIWHQIERLYHRRYRPRHHPDPGWRDGLNFTFDQAHPDEIPVRFIGVWETVGSLGIPDYLGWINPLDPAGRHNFQDLTLNPRIRHARHAVAMDEQRTPFSPTLWSGPAPGQDVKQIWFPGSHLDVGGCYPQRGLGDGTLLWMIEEAREAFGLVFHKRTLDQIQPDPFDVLHDDNLSVSNAVALLAPVVDPLLDTLFQPTPRAVPLVDPHSGESPSLHESVHKRQQTPPITSGSYRATRVLAVGRSETVDVFARKAWNDTGLYLEAGDYTFAARGEWRDGGSWSDPAGTTGPAQFRPIVERLVGTLSTLGQKLFRRLSGNEVASFPFSRREEDLPWMSLVGAVANNARPVKDAPNAHERIAIGSRTHHHVCRDGYLYTFANDAWGSYSNNDGTVQLTVTRTA